MNRRPFYFRSVAAAATADSATAAMSYRPHFRGGRPQIRRSYSDRPADHPEFVSGDSHFTAIRDANRGFRPNYNAVPPPPQYVTGQQFYGPGSGYHRPGPPQVYGPRPCGPYLHPPQVGPAFGNYQPFRPQQRPQQFRQRATKPPDYREWEYVKPGVPPHCERFSVLSYNILGDYLATEHWDQLYFHIPRYIMDWNWRKRNIIFELGLWSADILCLQEVDRFPDLEAELRPRGYNGIWKMRTGDPVDGCAIFWRESRFKLLHEESIEFNKLGLRDNVAQICVFESVKAQTFKGGLSTPSTSPASSNKVVVCNIHVLFNPKRGDIKLGQIRTLMNKANAVAKLWDDAPIVICGDFNCTPKSSIYNFITEQKLDLSELARNKVSGQTSAEIKRPPMPAFPNFRTPAADNSTQVSAGDGKKVDDAESLILLHSEAIEGRENVESDSQTLSETENKSEPSDASDSREATGVDITLDEKIKALSLDEVVVDGAIEESSPFLTDSDSHGNEILNENFKHENAYTGNYSCYTSVWTPAEIETATGKADCKVMEHPLKLTSAYTEVENSSGLRDSSGEPFVTSYHRRFLGTVDYIWHTEGLQTAMVLAPIPKHVMQQTRGFPTKKWGSDHIALVSEFAFAKETTSHNSNQ